jgi:hypothetical protein
MSFHAKTIRNLIGDDRLEEAIEMLIIHLEQDDDRHDLYDQMILLKSRFKDFKKKANAGVEEDKDLNSIRVALLNIIREMDQHPKEQVHQQPRNVPAPQVPQANPYIAQCFFNGDLNQYYVTPTNQIVMVNAITNFSMVVASRVTSVNPNFAWVYMFPNGFFYSIDHSGGIWGVNAFGLPMQLGYVQYY